MLSLIRCLLIALGFGNLVEAPTPLFQPRRAARRVSSQEEALVEAQMRLMSWVTPKAPPEVMELAMRLAFKDVPGFDAAYKDSICVDGRWRDLVRDYGLSRADWQAAHQGGL